MSDPTPLPSISINAYPPTKRAATTNVVATVLLWLVLLGVAFCGAVWALLYGFAADGCPVDAPCPAADAAGRAILIQWAGIAVIVIAALIGTAKQATRRKYTFHWPLGGIVLIGICTAITTGMANAAMQL